MKRKKRQSCARCVRLKASNDAYVFELNRAIDDRVQYKESVSFFKGMAGESQALTDLTIQKLQDEVTASVHLRDMLGKTTDDLRRAERVIDVLLNLMK